MDDEVSLGVTDINHLAEGHDLGPQILGHQLALIFQSYIELGRLEFMPSPPKEYAFVLPMVDLVPVWQEIVHQGL